jgi:hypothetical protein
MSGHDYDKFNQKVAQDVNRANFAAQSLDKKHTTTKVKIRTSSMEEVIPSGSTIELEIVPFHMLKFGDIILVRSGNDILLRRFLKYSIRAKHDIVLYTSDQVSPYVQDYSEKALNGKVISADSKGVPVNPYKKDRGLNAIRNRWTQYGTSTPIERLLANLKFLAGIMRPQK